MVGPPPREWRGWAVLDNDDELEDDTAATPVLNTDGTLSREIHWTSDDGKYVVVAGPFPHGFMRTTDAGTWEGASRKQVTGTRGLRSRPNTTRQDRFAKVLSKNITPTHNEYGEIAP